jgi:hypothetical protein
MQTHHFPSFYVKIPVKKFNLKAKFPKFDMASVLKANMRLSNPPPEIRSCADQ